MPPDPLVPSGVYFACLPHHPPPPTVHLFCYPCLWNANTHFGYHGTEKSAWSSTIVLSSPLHHPNHVNHTTVTQGGTRTHDLALPNGLPCFNHWVTESLGNSVAEFEYLRLSCQVSSWSRYQAGMADGEGVASAKHEAQAQILDMLRTWQSDLSPSESQLVSNVQLVVLNRI